MTANKNEIVLVDEQTLRDKIYIIRGQQVTEAVNLATKSGWGWIAFGVGFVAGFAFMSKAQRKYNGSWFS